MKYLDAKNNRLIFIEKAPTSKFWDSVWKRKSSKSDILQKFDLIVTPTTQKFLSLNSKILEGGCGHGTYVMQLNKEGFNCIGVDFAKETVKKINEKFPNVPVFYGDLKKLNFKDNSFDGYWSLGVIEHYYYGFDEVLLEMKRIIKKKGYVFITFPYMSPLRRLKAKLGIYHLLQSKKKPKNFYQFALNHKIVIEEFNKASFTLVMSRPFDGFSGLIKEITLLRFLLKPISKYSNKNIFIAGLRFIISKMVERFTSHAILLVFQKN